MDLSRIDDSLSPVLLWYFRLISFPYLPCLSLFLRFALSANGSNQNRQRTHLVLHFYSNYFSLFTWINWPPFFQLLIPFIDPVTPSSPAVASPFLPLPPWSTGVQKGRRRLTPFFAVRKSSFSLEWRESIGKGTLTVLLALERSLGDSCMLPTPRPFFCSSFGSSPSFGS